MKFFYSCMMLSVLVLVVMVNQTAYAQGDTLEVEWSDNDIDPIENNLRNVILGDTLSDGSRVPNRVYKLLRGGFYWNNDRIEANGFHLNIVGERGDPNDPIFGNPPTLQMVTRDDGSVDGKMITGSGSLTLKNVYLLGCDENGVQTSYQPIEMSGTDERYVFDNVIVERTNFSLIAFTNPSNTIIFRDSKFRNIIGRPSTQQWEGRGTSIWIDQDSVIVENCTFFNLGMTPFQLEGGSGSYVRFNHNTLVNFGRNLNAGNWWQEAYFTNNLFVNGFWHGEGPDDINNPNRDPRATSSGIFSIGDLPSVYGPEEGRRIAFANNVSYRDDFFETNYTNEGIVRQPFINPITKEDFFDVLDFVVLQDTLWADPQLTTQFSSTFKDSMWQNITDLRAGVTPAQDYMWKIPQLPSGDDCNVCPSWPIPEDFTYANATLNTYSTDGLPIGDLNWYPDSKAQWEANKEQFISDIEDIPGEQPELFIVDEIEAEVGTLTNGAEINVFDGFAYVKMEGGGYFEWTFNLAAATTVELNVETRSNDVQRGQRIIVNGTNIRNDGGFGEYFWDDLSPDWQTYRIAKDSLFEGSEALDLPAGDNTIRVEPSWGWQDFSGFEVFDGSSTTPLVTLTTPDITDFSIVELIGEGAAWTPQGFKSVALNGGELTIPMLAPENGVYRLSIFYQAPDGTQLIQIDDGPNSLLGNVSLTGVAGDSTGGNILTSSFMLDGGTHDIILAGDMVNIDYVQLIQEKVVGLEDEANRLDGFSLAQNYPNPFNPTTTILYSLAKRSDISLKVYNVLGQTVRTLIPSQKQVAGQYQVVWDGRDDHGNSVATGIYFYRLKAGDFVKSRKMALLK